MIRSVKTSTKRIQTFWMLICAIQIFVLSNVLGRTKETPQYAGGKAVLLPDLLKELDARKVIKRHVKIDSKSDKYKQLSLVSNRKLFRYNLINNETADGELNKTIVNAKNSKSMKKVDLGSKPKALWKSDKSKVFKYATKFIRHRRKKKKPWKTKMKNKYEISKSGKRRNGRTSKSRKMVKRKYGEELKSAKYEKAGSDSIESERQNEDMDSLSDDGTPPVRFSNGGYHLVPYARIYPMYRRNLMVYPSMQRNRFYDEDPYYNDRYFFDYDTQRKDVIPKPRVAPLTERGAKKDTFYKEQSDKRMAYSPIVSAVQNLDRSEANLFDSLLSTSHETNRFTDDIGSEYSNFIGSPSELEAYSPTDTPGGVYFEKDQKGDGEHAPHLTTNRPTESELDPSDIVDNEEKLLAIVQKVIEKQKKKEKAESKPSKEKTGVSQMKNSGSFDIGDTSKVFNTESGDKESDVDSKLHDFLSKQPKYVKKIKAPKKGRSSHGNSQNRHLMVTSKKVPQDKGERAKIKVKSRKNNPGFALSKTGQHVIVENMTPEDNLLMTSLTQLEGSVGKQIDNSHIKYGARAKGQRLKNEKASIKSLSSKIKESQETAHVIEEIMDQDRKGGLSEGKKNGLFETHERHNGFETTPLSIHESYASRYKINGRDIPVVSELSPSEWFSEEKSQQVATGMKKDENKPENSTKSGKETASSDKEDTKETGTSEKNISEENLKEGVNSAAGEKNVTESTENDATKGKVNETQNPMGLNGETNGGANGIHGSKEAEDSIDDLFEVDGADASIQPSVTPAPEVGSFTSPKSDKQIPGWRIRDYYLNSNNASNWDQIRTAWMGKNGSQFVFNNRINVNPQGTVDSPITMPPIRFVNGITMPMLPTIGAPTGIPPHGFPFADDDEIENDESEVQQQQKVKNQQQQPGTTPSYGLQYPWQWHNRGPKGNRYPYQQLHFHGKSTHPTFRPPVVTTRVPITAGTSEVLTKPSLSTSTQGQNNITGASVGGKNEPSKGSSNEVSGSSEEKPQDEKTEEQGSQNQNGQHEDNYKTQNDVNGQKDIENQGQKEDKDVGNNETLKGQNITEQHDALKTDKGADGKNDSNSQEQEHFNENSSAGDHEDVGKLISVGRWTDSRKDVNVIKESATYKNTTLRRFNETMKVGDGRENSNINQVPQGSIGTYTKAPEELPILSQPTTKSVQNFLPGVKPPVSVSKQVQSERKDVYPPWSGAYVEQLRKGGWTGRQMEGAATGGARSEGTGKQDSKVESGMHHVLTEESTSKVPYDEELGNKKEQTGISDAAARNSFAYESNLLQKEESENAAIRARVTDSPINRQAESINEIRHRANGAQKAAQRQLVLKDNTTVEQSNQEGTISQRNYTTKAPVKTAVSSGTEMEQKQPMQFQNTHVTAIPKTTAAKPMTEEFHHPTPKPLFPLIFSSRLPTKIRSDSQDAKKVPESPTSRLSNAQVSNTSSDQRNVYIPMAYESAQTTTESTTPSIFGYKTTDWAKAFTTTENASNLAPQANIKVSDSSERLKKPEQRPSGVGPEGPLKVNNEHDMKTVQTSFVVNQTVTEGRYQTDKARVRTAEKVTIQVPEKALENVPTLSMSAPQISNGNVIATNWLQYQGAYPSIGNTAVSLGPQPNYYNGYQSWPATPNPAMPVSTMQSTEAVSDSYLTKFGDQLNMEDLSWTDSTEEKEQICKQEKGTNEVVHILCFGDSLTRGYYNKGKSHHPYTNKLQFLLNKLDTKKCYIIENEGKDGELAYEEMPKRLESSLKDGDTKYDWIVILGGTNDIYNKKKSKSVSEDAITQNIISMHEIARKHNSKSVAVTIPEVFCETQETCQDARQLRERVNNNIRSYALRNAGRVVLVDLADMLQRVNVGRDMAAQFFEGGLHLKPRGYERMAIIIYEGLKKSLS